MEVTRIDEGLWRWSVTADGVVRASAYLEHGDAMLLVDPVLPPPGDDLERFKRAIARDLARLRGPVHVLLTRRDDPRDADALAATTGGRVWTTGRPEPPGIVALPGDSPGEVGLWSAAHRALMPGRALPRPGSAMAALPARVVIPSVGPMRVA